MNDYKYAVERLARKRISMEFDNKGKSHAAIVLESMFQNAKENIKIYSGKLNSAVANDSSFLKAFNIFIESKKELKIILENIPEVENQSNALKRVLSLSNNPAYNVKYKVATPEFKNELEKRFKSSKAYHFAVSDGLAYRVEIDPSEYKALCNYNDPIIATKLESVFDSFFEEQSN